MFAYQRFAGCFFNAGTVCCDAFVGAPAGSRLFELKGRYRNKRKEIHVNEIIRGVLIHLFPAAELSRDRQAQLFPTGAEHV